MQKRSQLPILIPIILLIFSSSGIFAQEKALDSIKNETSLTFTIPQKDSARYYQIKSIHFEGNKITKDKVIWRELNFREGDSIKGKNLFTRLEKSRENLRNLSLFNFVHITASLDSSCAYCTTITIRFIEQWYIWPFPIFEVADRNFNTWWKKKDFSRLNYGVFFEHKNFLGLNQKLKLLLRFGHDQKYELSYYNPYINKKQTIGMGISAGAKLNHETAYMTDSNNEELFYKDDNVNVKKEFYFGFDFTLRRNIYNTHVLSVKYIMNHFADSLVILNPEYSPGQKTEVNYTQLHYMFRSDHRDYKHYPLGGWYFDVSMTQKGIPGSEDLNMFDAVSSFRKYWKLHERWFFASGVTGKISSKGAQPYFAQRGLGYGRDFVRGYEYYVIDGQDYALLKTNLKLALIQPHIHKFGFIRNEKFNTVHYAIYMNFYLDAGHVWDQELQHINDLDDQLLLGGGIGLDFVTYYDKVLRVEYSVNKMGEGGVFLHFIAPI